MVTIRSKGPGKRGPRCRGAGGQGGGSNDPGKGHHVCNTDVEVHLRGSDVNLPDCGDEGMHKSEADNSVDGERHY